MATKLPCDSKVPSLKVRTYLKGVINCWRISSGWFKLLHKIALTASIVITSLATMSNFSSSTQSALGIVAVILQGIAFFCQAMSDYAADAVQDHQKILTDIKTEEDEANGSNPPPLPPNEIV